jgi:hypothetical protein
MGKEENKAALGFCLLIAAGLVYGMLHLLP